MLDLHAAVGHAVRAAVLVGAHAVTRIDVGVVEVVGLARRQHAEGRRGGARLLVLALVRARAAGRQAGARLRQARIVEAEVARALADRDVAGARIAARDLARLVGEAEARPPRGRRYELDRRVGVLARAEEGHAAFGVLPDRD